MEISTVSYLAYGSNLSRTRLRAYIDGAPADSPFGSHEPCDDRSATPALGAHWLPGRLSFGGHSPRWGGGTATVDLAATDDRFLAVEYALSRVQLTHLIRHESPTNTGALDWRALSECGRCTVGEGGHGVVARPAGHHGFLVTTEPAPMSTTPPATYVSLMRHGLVDWVAEDEADAYLRRSITSSRLA